MSDDLLLFGGSCPKCFATIPGEEVATDPGAIVRAEQAEGDRRRSRWKTLIPVIIGVPFLVGVAAVALTLAFVNQDPVLEPLEFGEEMALYDEVVEAPPEPEPGTGKDKPGPRRVRPTSGTPVQAPVPAPGGTAAEQPVPKIEKKVGGLDFGGPQVVVGRATVELCEPDQISNMVQRAMKKQQGSLGRCYNAALTRNPKLNGRWKGRFVINKAGRPTDVSFTGRTMQDAEMESCLVTTVKGWSFGKICSTQEVRKTWRFQK